MSGGFFNYDEYKLLAMLDDIDNLNYYSTDNWSKETKGCVEEIKKNLNNLFWKTQAFDCFISGDISEEEFLKRYHGVKENE